MAEKSFEQALGELTNVATEITKAMYSAAQEHGKDAVDLILATYRFEGISSLLMGVGLLVIAYLAFQNISKKLWKLGKEAFEKDNYPDSGVGFYITAVISLIISAFVLVVGLVKLLDIWNWASAIDPRLYLAHMFLKKVGL